MNLPAQRVKELQAFLMESAQCDVAAGGAGSPRTAGLLESAAALDYVLLLASERPQELLDAAGPVAVGARSTLTRAARAALDFIRSTLATSPDVSAGAGQGYGEPGGIFITLRALASAAAFERDDIAFALVTTASDVLERSRRSSP